MKKSYIFNFLILVFVLFLLPFLTNIKAEWIKFQNNPIIPTNVDKKELLHNPRSPAILMEEGVIKMWFVNEISNKWYIDYIYSKDGINWIKPYIKPLISPYNNEVLIGEPTIVKVDNKYHLWFTALTQDSSFFTIKYAYSYDSYNWIREEKDIITPTKWWESKGVVNPYVLYINNQYLMWYGAWGSDGIWRIGFARSNDGVNWMKYENPLNISPNIQHVGNHNLKFFDNSFHLWYLTGDGNTEEIYELTSTNGIEWSCSKEDCLVFRKNRSDFPNTILNDSDTVKIGNKIFLYFAGIHNNNWGIGLLSNYPLYPHLPLILLPGLFGSWNKEAILYNQQVGVFDWKLLPFVKEYEGIINTLKNERFQEDKDFFIFPYDWRKSIDQSSNDLKTFIDTKIPQDKKVNLIGHSLGGLVARIFTQKNKDKVNKLITVGSPHEGAVQVYKPLSAGEIDRENSLLWLAQKLILVLNKSSLETDRETIRKKFPVAYDLFPTFNFLKNEQNQEEIPITNLSIKNNLLLQYNQTFPEIFPLFIAFYGEKDSRTPAGYTVTSPDLLNQILGNYQDGQPVNIFYEPGDYTVLSKSANKDTDSEKLVFDHGEIITEKEAIRKILNQLNIFPNEIYPGKKTTITPSLIFLIKSPAKITIKTPDNQLIEETDGIIFLENAQPGEYQLQIQGTNKGKYTLITGQITENNDIWETKEGEIIQEPPSSQTETYSFYFDTNQPQSIFPTPTPQATPSPTPTSALSPTPALTPISTSPSPTPLSTNQTSASNNNNSQSSNNNFLTQENNLISKNIKQATFLKPTLENKKEAVLGVKNNKKKEIENKQNKKNNLTGIILVILSLIIASLLIFFKTKKKGFNIPLFQK